MHLTLYNYSMKTALVLASIAILAGISNHGCESAPAGNPKPKINRLVDISKLPRFQKLFVSDVLGLVKFVWALVYCTGKNVTKPLTELRKVFAKHI